MMNSWMTMNDNYDDNWGECSTWWIKVMMHLNDDGKGDTAPDDDGSDDAPDDWWVRKHHQELRKESDALTLSTSCAWRVSIQRIFFKI